MASFHPVRGGTAPSDQAVKQCPENTFRTDFRQESANADPNGSSGPYRLTDKLQA
jgi:hypothetical protein